VFNLVPNNDKDHWWETGHASQMNMQFNEWLKSKHAKSLETMQSSKDAAPACLECHSADYRLNSVLIAAQKAGDLQGDPIKLPTLRQAKFSVTCISCHDPHGDSKSPAQLAAKDSYTLCTSCHRATDVTKALHHPSREMFEGLTLIKDLPGIPSAHFADARGPRCQSCHMSSVPVQGTTNVTHTFLSVLPGKANGKLPDSCSGCHDKLKPNDLQSLIDGTQDAVRARLAVAWARVGTLAKPDQPGKAADSYNAIVNALTFVQNDGSLGVHNYAYADALLNYAERALSELSVPGAKVQPTEGPAPTAVSAAPAPVNTNAESSVPTGLRPPTVVSLSFFGLILLIGAVAIFRKSGKGEA
jgi:predicted CXXCH cytochrome family protein